MESCGLFLFVCFVSIVLFFVFLFCYYYCCCSLVVMLIVTNRRPLLSVVNGNWATWSSWSACSKSCDNGTQARTRTCTNPSPQNGGSNCTGNDRQTQHCNTKRCPGKINHLSLTLGCLSVRVIVYLLVLIAG